MNTPTISNEQVSKQKEPSVIGKHFAGLTYMNLATGEISNNQDEVLSWVLYGDGAKVLGYYTYEWNGNEIVERWEDCC